MRRWTVLVLLALVTGAVPPAAQELPRESVRRTTGVGTYGGTMDGRMPPRVVAGSLLEEEMHCNVELTFSADGSVTADLRRYVHLKAETKRSQAGRFKIIQRITAEPARVTVPSALFLWVTPSSRVQNAQWQREPGPDFVGQVTTEVFQEMGQDRWQRVQHSSDRVMVYCYPKVLWQGRDGRGSGLGLSDTYVGPDVFGKREWVTINAQWRLTPLGARPPIRR